MDWRSAHTMLHEQAIYQRAEQFQVETLDFDNRKRFVRKVWLITSQQRTPYRTFVTQVDERGPLALSSAGTYRWSHGEVSVVDKVVGFKKIRFQTHENVGYGEVNLPVMQMHTTSVWLTLSQEFVDDLPWQRPVIMDALSGISKALHLYTTAGLMIDAGDLGFLVDERREEQVVGSERKSKFEPTIYLFERIPGGQLSLEFMTPVVTFSQGLKAYLSLWL